jgi:hypothetical protein
MSMIRARHTVSGVIAEVPEDIFNHDVLGEYLERVEEDAKPLVPELHKPRKAEPEAVTTKKDNA